MAESAKVLQASFLPADDNDSILVPTTTPHDQQGRNPIPDLLDLKPNEHIVQSPILLSPDAILLEPPPPSSPQSREPFLDLTTQSLNFDSFYSNSHEARTVKGVDANRDATTSQLLDGLHIRTDLPSGEALYQVRSNELDTQPRRSASSNSLPRRIPSVRAAFHSTAGSVSPGSVISSPQLAALLDMTPLPSPTLTEFSRLAPPARSRHSSTASSQPVNLSIALAASPPRKKPYHGLRPINIENQSATAKALTDDNDAGRERNRSISEYVPDSLAAQKPKNVAVSGMVPPREVCDPQTSMHREEYLGAQRGLLAPIAKPQTPVIDSIQRHHTSDDLDQPAPKRARMDVYTAESIWSGTVKKYTSIRELGQGTFSTVYLAVRQVATGDDGVDYARDSTNMAGIRARSKRLVAVKVIEPGPPGGVDAARYENSLRREVRIMKALKHPSIVHLKAVGDGEDGKKLLVMNYCPGKDLFEVASERSDVLVPSLIRRIFSELVSAVRYLHLKGIVHRDIKLENVLMNIPAQVYADVADWQKVDRAVVTLSDLGLSREIPEPPESPLLETRCGSEDYAAPEVLMGQRYDGRKTDAWALGVVLYALMEGRLPFDPMPGARGDPTLLRKRTPHRIARCDYAWCKYGDEDGDWDREKGKDLQDAFVCVDGLLKRETRRKPLSEIRDMPWVRDGIDIDGGLHWVDEE